MSGGTYSQKKQQTRLWKRFEILVNELKYIHDTADINVKSVNPIGNIKIWLEKAYTAIEKKNLSPTELKYSITVLQNDVLPTIYFFVAINRV